MFVRAVFSLLMFSAVACPAAITLNVANYNFANHPNNATGQDQLRTILRFAKARSTEASQLASLTAERDKLTENLRGALLLGPASLKRMSKDLEQWEAALEALDRRIANLEKAAPMQPHDVDSFVGAVSVEFKKMAESLGTVPANAVRQLLASLITRLEIDMTTLAVQMEVALPQGVSGTANGPMLGLVHVNRWADGNDTQRSGTLKIADVACRGTVGVARKPPCFVCSRLAA